jgi:shikimate kinase
MIFSDSFGQQRELNLSISSIDTLPHVNNNLFLRYCLTVKPSKSNIILIGMPGSGKSTIGVILAKMLAKSFVDTDILIQEKEHQTLQDIVNEQGYMMLRSIEERVLLGVDFYNHVIATGGSAAYSERAMYHLKDQGLIVFLDADLATLQVRIGNYEQRGLAKRPEQSLQDLFNERLALYRKYADIVIDCSKMSQESVCETIIQYL